MKSGDEPGGKPGGRIKSPLMFFVRGRKGGEGNGSCQPTAKSDSFTFRESVQPIFPLFPFILLSSHAYWH